jgi:hypothetical protein
MDSPEPVYGLSRLADEERLADSADEHFDRLGPIFGRDPTATEESMLHRLAHTTWIAAGHLEVGQYEP